jgi:hypothetical protein
MDTLFTSNYFQYVILGLIGISYLLVFWFGMQNKRYRKKYLKLVEGVESPDLEKILILLQNEVFYLRNCVTNQELKFEHLAEKLKHMKSHVYIHRYSAFSDEATGLSYSVVLLDEYMNGLVITGLYNREQSFTYAKPIENGQSKYKLSPEELIAIQKTIETSRGM